MPEARAYRTIATAQTHWIGLIMCSIFGAITNKANTVEFSEMLRTVMRRSRERGRDGFGWAYMDKDRMFTNRRSVGRENSEKALAPAPISGPFMNLIGNARAEPTTEYVEEKDKNDQQPYFNTGWNIVHNGTIANDKELRQAAADGGILAVPTAIDSAAIAETLALVRSQSSPDNPSPMGAFGSYDAWVQSVRKLKGSFAILGQYQARKDVIFFACNYRPIWIEVNDVGLFIASSRDYLPGRTAPQMIKPYTIGWMTVTGIGQQQELNTKDLSPLYLGKRDKALVVCSGGLDSVVSATIACKQYDVTLIHFQYGCRAEGPEVAAVRKVAAHLNVPLKLFPLPIYSKGDSPLFDSDSKVAGGEAGAEFAHEWVPARNLVLLSVAVAYAEANGFEVLVLGNNLEEAGAYPDNEPEFIKRFNDILPFAVGDGKRMRVEMPVGNMMKHEIVHAGLVHGAPMHLTWSCYRAGEQHCGTCGPCFMRRTAFKINGAEEVIAYEKD